MDNQASGKMLKSFKSDSLWSILFSDGNQEEFTLSEEDRLKQEEDYRQGKYIIFNDIIMETVRK